MEEVDFLTLGVILAVNSIFDTNFVVDTDDNVSTSIKYNTKLIHSQLKHYSEDT